MNKVSRMISVGFSIGRYTRFTQVLIPCDVANIRHGGAIQDNSHVCRGALATRPFAISIDGIGLVEDSGAQAKGSQSKGKNDETEN